jgi:2-polyprenyl-3-methyl-5-hydroxy-6-metoxy-1,4-benzoquinol methylase
MEPRSDKWNTFWAQLLRIDFFDGQWEMYRKVADSRAEWLEQAFRLSTDKPILSCACGEGGIELALARRGFNVTGIDICPAFIHFARSQAAKEGLDNVVFLTADLRDDSALPSGFGVVYCFDTFGLLGEEDEQKVLRKMAAALNAGGLLLVDSPQRDSQAPSRKWWPLNEGYLLMETRWDPKSGVTHIEPRFINASGELINLVDPYDRSQTEHTGVLRYLYTPEELARQINHAGLYAQGVPHQRQGYYMLAARAGGS